MKTDIIVRLGYYEIFTQRRTIKSLLKEVNIKDSILLLSSLNKNEYKLRERDNGELQFILQEWLIKDKPEIINKIVSAYAKHANKNYKGGKLNVSLKSVVLINRISTLRLLEVLCANNENLTNNKNISSEKSRENLLKLYLLISDEIAKRQDLVFNKFFKENRTNIDEIHLHLFFGITQPFHHYYNINALQPEIYKFLLFEKWFRNNEPYSKLLQDYVKGIGLDNWHQYFNGVFKLSMLATESNILELDKYPILKTLVEHLKINTSNSTTWGEFVNIRKNPIVKIDGYRYAVLDFEFLLNKFFSSLYHDLITYSKEKGIMNFHQDYGKEFVEGILLENAFYTSFGSSYKQFSEKQMKSFGVKNIENIGLPDYYIRNGGSVMMFECKNSFISNNNKIYLNTDALLREIKEKFYFTTNKGTNKRKSKGVLQLLDFILNSMDGKYLFFDNVKAPENLTYYPILIVTDNTLSSFGFNQLLDHYFQIELERAEIRKKYKLKPLTIIHIDDFFIHQTRLKRLNKLILEYHKFLRDKHGFEAMISFSDYLDRFKFPKSLNPRKEHVQHIIKDSLLPPE